MLYGKPTGLPSGFWFSGEERRYHRPEPVDRCEGGPDHGDHGATPGLPCSCQVRAWGRCPAAEVEGCSAALAGGPSQADAPIPSPSSTLAKELAGPGGAPVGLRPQCWARRLRRQPSRGKLPGQGGVCRLPPLAMRSEGQLGSEPGLPCCSPGPAPWPRPTRGARAAAAGRVARPRLRRGAGWAALLPALAEAPSGFPLPARPSPAPAPPWGQREAVGNLSINLSAWGLLVRWCLSGLCSCQMGLPEPVGEGGRREPLLQGLEAASPSLAFTSPPPRRGPPSLPHQDTEHCMNSGLNGIMSEFWSTANSGYFTNYLSLLCGGQSLGRGP